jgi:cell division protein FtsL
MFDPSLTLSIRVLLFFVIVWFLVLSVIGSHIQSEAAHLKGELALTLEELKCSQVAEQKALKARMAASARLTRLKKVCKKVRLKEWRLAK